MRPTCLEPTVASEHSVYSVGVIERKATCAPCNSPRSCPGRADWRSLDSAVVCAGPGVCAYWSRNQCREWTTYFSWRRWTLARPPRAGRGPLRRSVSRQSGNGMAVLRLERRKRHATVVANPAHFALAELERKLGERFFLCTQNVDSLHEQAGSQRIVHMHCRLMQTRCSRETCRTKPFEDDRVLPVAGRDSNLSAMRSAAAATYLLVRRSAVFHGSHLRTAAGLYCAADGGNFGGGGTSWPVSMRMARNQSRACDFTLDRKSRLTVHFLMRCCWEKRARCYRNW